MKVLSDALASAAITQQQAVTAQKAADDAENAGALSAQQLAFARTMSDAVAAAAAAGNFNQQQAVAAQAAADAAVQTAALAAQATAQAASLAQAVASAVASQAASDATKQQSAVAAQASAGAAAQQAALSSQVAQDATAQATALAAQIASDRLKWLPSFYNTNNLSLPVAVGGQTFTVDKSLTNMDYSHTWLLAFGGWLPNPTPSSTSYNALLTAQAVGGASLVALWNPAYYPYTTPPAMWSQNSAGGAYSGWLRPGTATQRCGWVINTGTSSAPSWSLVVTPYGFTSASPTARYPSTLAQTYTLTTSDAQAEVVGKMAVSTNTVWCLGFIYDASVGDYGQVTWISQI
jgi:hypothetical protein